ncbi:unnamed protein product [Mytilus coruscus]|uniref:Uncharacterized protein n=1 Tax=Mytilus coruscus TaxID=42192 RepID=A0A6J8EAS9_MYTCO|nr:unnamed protein product [Mytilus coruscus]
MEKQYHQILKDADEDLCVPTATPKIPVVFNARSIPCFICQLPMRHPYRHAIMIHLTWYTAPEYACFHCKQQLTRLNHHIQNIHPDFYSEAKVGPEKYQMWEQLLNGLLRELARILEVSYPEGLTNFVNSLDILGNKTYGAAKNPEFRAEEIFNAEIFCQINKLSKFNLRFSTTLAKHTYIH